ncbi:MAG: acyltransferase family protein, partial [Muribaculaceae bacterium]
MVSKSARRLNGVDAMKFIMAFAVVIIHIQCLFKVEYSASINWFIRLAVPYFFIASGFLTACRFNNLDSLSDKSKYLKRKALRFGKMFLLWLLIYMPISLVAFDYSDISALSKDIVLYVSNVILIGESKFAWPLWYLYSSMIAYFILCVSVRRRWGKIAALLIAAFVIARLLV